MMKETDESLGCILFVIAVALLIFIVYHGEEIAAKLLGGC